MNFAEDYKDFITKGKTERLCVEESVRLAKEKGFVDIKEVKELKTGDKVYAVNKAKTLQYLLLVNNQSNKD